MSDQITQTKINHFNVIVRLFILVNIQKVANFLLGTLTNVRAKFLSLDDQ